MAVKPTIRRLLFTGIGVPNRTRAEAEITFAANGDEAVLTVQCTIDVDDDTSFSVLQEKVFQALEQIHAARRSPGSSA